MKQIRSTKQVGLSRIERARIVRDEVMTHSSAHGRWERIVFDEGRKAQLWCIEPGSGWFANISTRFSLAPETPPKVEAYDEALLLQLAPPRVYDLVLDLYVAGFGKVLSLGTTDGVDTLITMQPGPWEVMFGLESRPSGVPIARRLADRSLKASTN